MAWTVYILECADHTLYTGITTNLLNRLAMHTDGSGAKYTRGRHPFRVVFKESHTTRGAALKREAQIKSLTREQKLEFTSGLRAEA